MFRIHGQLDIQALRASFAAVLRRHDVFRMTFPGPDLTPMHHDQPLYRFAQTDLEATISADLLDQRIAEEITRPFDIKTGPLIRLHLFVRNPEQFILLMVMHHSITDLRAKELLGREISECYGAIAAKQQVPDAEPASCYLAYHDRLQAWLASPAADRMRDYWKTELQDFEGLIQLPLDHPRPSIPAGTGNAHFFHVPPEQAETLREACRKRAIAPFVALLTCFLILLARYSRQNKIIIGVPLSNRRQEADKDTMGCYVNILPITFEYNDDTTLLQATGMVRGKLLQAHRNQELPFHEIVAAVQPQPEPSHNPIFQVGFTHEPPMELHLAGLTVVSEKRHNLGAQMDLFLNLFEITPGIQGYLEYDRALFDEGTVAAISRHYQRLITEWHTHCDQPINRVDLLSPAEKNTVLHQWNDTAADYGTPECTHRLFERQAARTPAATALVFNGTTLTYQEFNARANRLAHYIIARGGGPESIVGVFMERSLEMVIALYGILKAGAAYLPLEPELPAQRLALILEESGTTLVLSHKQLPEKLPPFAGTVLRLDTQWPSLAGYSQENPADRATSGNLAYVIYTSGSTGKPKGVMVTHGSLFNRLLWMQDAYKLKPEDRVLQKTSFDFDVSVWEFFWPLIIGAPLVVAPPESHRDPIKLCQAIQDNAITTIHFVPSMLRIFLDADEAARCQSLRQVFCSGEALSWNLRNAFLAKMDCELHNLYGPTEATVDVSYWDCRSETYPGKVPIGYPVANTQLYILDDYLQPVSPGVIGDLYIGGVQVARGYLGREALTRERFIPDPFDPTGNGRLYKTGDLARHLPDGAVEYIGRSDFQVKLFGNRIELTEIEATLRTHPRIADAVVTLFGQEKGGQQLVAHLLTEVRSTEELQPKKYLMDTLPYYMVPNSYVLMSAFPLTGSGKVNRKQLPVAQPREEAPPKPPRARTADRDVTALVAAIWDKILNNGEVKTEYNFFDAGGTSLQVAELAVALEAELGIRVPLVKVFQYPTVTALAGYLEEKIRA